MKRFASIWLPAFAIDRMRRQQPGLVPQDKPAVLVESGPRGIVVTAVNGPAARGSIQPGQMLADVRAVLPGLLTHLAQPGRDRRALHQLALWLGRYGPSRNTEGNDGLWVETTGAAHLFGGEEALARDCIERLRRVGLQASVAIADTRSAAFALARYGLSGKQFVIAPKGDTRAALADLPVEGLQLTGDLVILLRRLGLKRIGQLYGLPRAALARRFREAAPRGGSNRRHSRGLMRQSRHAGWAEALVMRLDQALGELGEPARGMIEPPVHRFHRAYAEPLISHEGILAALDELAKRLCAALMERDEGARMLRFTICRADGSAADVLVRTIRPASEPQHVAELFRMRMERMDAGFGIDAIVLEALKTQRLEHEQESLAGARGAGGGPGDRRDPGELVDRLVNRLGNASVFYLQAAASHIPERAQKRSPALNGAPRRMSGNDDPAGGEMQAVKPTRPAFMLRPAEPIDVIAEIPDGPPARFTWRRVMRRIVHAEGPERIAPEWWRMLAGTPFHYEEQTPRNGGEEFVSPKPAGRIRDYYRIEDAHGGRYWIYRAGLYPASEPADILTVQTDQSRTGRVLEQDASTPPIWFLQGIF